MHIMPNYPEVNLAQAIRHIIMAMKGRDDIGVVKILGIDYRYHYNYYLLCLFRPCFLSHEKL